MKANTSSFSNRYRNTLRQANAVIAIGAIALFAATASAHDQDGKRAQAIQADRPAISQSASESRTSIVAPSFWKRDNDHENFDRH